MRTVVIVIVLLFFAGTPLSLFLTIPTLWCAFQVMNDSDKSAPLRVERSFSLNPITLFLRFRSARIITVEPVIFLYMFGSYLHFPLYQQYFFNQFAKEVIGNSSKLPNKTYYCLTSNLTDEYGGNGTYVEVETLSSHLNIYVSLCNQIPAIIFTLLYGPLSDRFGRRLVIIIVSLGAITQGLLSMGIVHWNLSVYLFMLSGAVAGVGGDFSSVLMASFAYISDVSSSKWLTFRIGVVEAMMYMAGAVALGAGGLWFKMLNCNFIPPLTVFISCHVLIIAYVALFLPKSLPRKERERRALEKSSCFDSLVRGSKIYFCQIKKYTVWVLWAALIAFFFMELTSERIAVYFLKAKKPFDWDSSTIGYYQMTVQLSHMFGLLIVLPVLVALKLPDALISIIGLGFSAGMNIFTGLANKTFEMFIIGVIQGVEAIAFPPLRSIQSKAVDKADQGALFSVVTAVENGASLVSALIFPIVIPLALQHGLSPGVVYLLMASMCILPLLLLLLLLFCGRRKRRTDVHDASTQGTPDHPPVSTNNPDVITSSETSPLLS